jgi:hypothetical protein
MYLPQLHDELVDAAGRPPTPRRLGGRLAGAVSAAMLTLLVAAPATHAIAPAAFADVAPLSGGPST